MLLNENNINFVSFKYNKGGSPKENILPCRCFLRSVVGRGCCCSRNKSEPPRLFFVQIQHMNKQSRKELAEIVSELEALRDRIEALKDEEQEKFDNLNEGLQQTERGQELENAVSVLEEAESDIDNTIDNLNEIL